jgi:hypothetical protein
LSQEESNKGGWINNAVEVVVSKTGKNIIQVKKDLVLKEGQRILLKSFADDLADKVSRGYISEEAMNERLTRQSFVKAIGSVAPVEDKSNVDF